MITSVSEWVSENYPKYVVQKSQRSNSIYIHISNTKDIRISDHISTANAGKYVNILITRDKEFVVAFKNVICVLKTFKRLCDWLDDFLTVHEGIYCDYSNTHNGMTEEINQLRSQNDHLKKDIEQLKILNINLANNPKDAGQKAEIKRLSTLVTEKNTVIKNLQKDNSEKADAIKEAVDLIQTLTTDPDSRDLLYSRNTGKTYYIDNFPDSMQEIINDLIKTYNK